MEHAQKALAIVSLAVLVCVPTRALAQEMRVYRDNPLRTPRPELKSCSETPSATHLASPHLRVRSCVPTSVASDDPLACKLDHVAIANGAGNFLFEPRRRPTLAADPFAEVSAYYHASRVLAYMASLGIARDKVFATSPLDIVVGGQVPAKTGTSGRVISKAQGLHVSAHQPEGAVARQQLDVAGDLVWLGFGAKLNMAYDGDVVIHETLHAVFRDQGSAGWVIGRQGAHRDAPAVAEAFADYFTAVITQDPMIGEYLARTAARDLRGRHRLPFRTGVPHRDGLRLSQALWRARGRLSSGQRREFDQVLVSFARSRPAGMDKTIDQVGSDILKRLSRSPKLAATVRRTFRELGLLSSIPVVVSVSALGSEIPPHELFLLPHATSEGTMGPASVQFRVSIPHKVSRLRGSLDVVPTEPSPWSTSLASATSPPPELVVVVSFDTPVRWHDGRVQGTHLTTTTRRAFGFPVPSDASVAYVQIASPAGSDLGFRRPVFSFMKEE